jgi:flagellar motor switch protein FliG
MTQSMPLTGPEKAVLMLLSLDESAAAPIVAELEPAELRKLREVAVLMRAVPTTALDEVYGEFVERSQEAIAVPRGGVSYLRRLAQKALGETRSQEIFVDSPQSGMERLALAPPTSVASVLENEHPQVIAALLSQLEAQRAARILEALPTELQPQVLGRLGTMTEVPAGMLDGVAAAVSAELPPVEAEASMSVDGVARAAGLVRKLDKTAAATMLGQLNQDQAEVAAEIRRALYSFEDLKSLDPKALRTLLKEVQNDRLVLALKTASDALKQQIFASMSSRAAEYIKDDLSNLGSVRLTEVEAAQREIVEAALRLEAEGSISLGGDGDDMV